jgi:hypothetical protein
MLSSLLRRIVLGKPNGIRGDDEQASDGDQHTEDEQREARVAPNGFAVLMGRKHQDRSSESAEKCTEDYPLQDGRLGLGLRHRWYFLSLLHWDLVRHLWVRGPFTTSCGALMAASSTTADDSSRIALAIPPDQTALVCRWWVCRADDLAFAKNFNHVMTSASSDEGASIAAAHAALGLGEL